MNEHCQVGAEDAKLKGNGASVNVAVANVQHNSIVG